MHNKKIVSIIGARPNIIKSAVLSEKIKETGFNEIIIHTGQHYDYELSEKIFLNLNMKPPDITLNIGSGFHGYQTGRMLIEIEKSLLNIKPNCVITFGDTNSTLAGALAAAKLNFPLVHIEAGERSFINGMPEEINRKICDHISNLNCCATKLAVAHLKKEFVQGKIVFTGDLMLDLFIKNINNILPPKVQVPEKFILLTIHRAENTNNKIRLRKLIKILGNLELEIVWPLHPRTKKALKDFNIKLPKNIFSFPPVSYTEMLWLEFKSKLIITDSGGVQKEAYWQQKPCINIMPQTAWQTTMEGGWNQSIFENFDEIKKAINQTPKGKPKINIFGNGSASTEICIAIERLL